MELSGSEREALVDALLKTYPSRAALVETVRYQFGEDLEAIAGSGGARETIYNLVVWAEKQGRTAELIQASLQWNPQSSAMSEFMSSGSRSTRQAKRTMLAPTPRLSTSLRKSLIDALLLVPDIDSFETRSRLLIGIPWRATLTRGWSDVRSDLEAMVDQLGSLGRLASGAWPLLILADNARAHAEGTEAAVTLDRTYKRLLTFYADWQDRASER